MPKSIIDAGPRRPKKTRSKYIVLELTPCEADTLAEHMREHPGYGTVQMCALRRVFLRLNIALHGVPFPIRPGDSAWMKKVLRKCNAEYKWSKRDAIA